MAEIDIVADQIERRLVADLIPYARNSRLHSAESVNKLAAGMREWGWTYPCLIDEDNGLICGHGRVLAAQKLKLTEVPVIVAKGWSEEKKRAYVIWDNKSSDLSIFDPDVLKIELSDLQSGGFDLSLTGFSSLELTSIFATQEGNTDPDEAPEPPAVPVSQAGDLWTFDGGHRLICGDCTSKEVVDRLLEGRKPHLLVSDQPFGVEYDPAWRSTEVPQVGKWKAPNRSHGAVQNDHRADWREAWALFPGDVIYVWHDASNPAATQLALEACGFEVRSQIIWRKSSMAVGRGHYHWAHEAMFYAVRKTANGHWAGDRKQTTVWDIDAPKRSETGHGTQKPVECMARPILNNSAPGDLVLDPFIGSGSSMIAAHTNKRVALGIEIDPKYCDVVCQRMIGFTGAQPILAETGETFEQVKARRLEVV